ncbi:MAG: hypothetical protein ACM3SR_11705 [Ignavibacteriales bacterium]
MDQINKTGLDDFLVGPNGREKFQELLAEARPTIELQLEEDTPTELLVKEISRIQSEIEKDKWVKSISEKRGISQRAINKDLKNTSREKTMSCLIRNILRISPNWLTW